MWPLVYDINKRERDRETERESVQSERRRERVGSTPLDRLNGGRVEVRVPTAVQQEAELVHLQQVARRSLLLRAREIAVNLMMDVISQQQPTQATCAEPESQ